MPFNTQDLNTNIHIHFKRGNLVERSAVSFVSLKQIEEEGDVFIGVKWDSITTYFDHSNDKYKSHLHLPLVSKVRYSSITVSLFTTAYLFVVWVADDQKGIV